jgi:hypothetical protein
MGPKLFAVLLILLANLIAAGTSSAQSDGEWRRRFLEELNRKMPPVSVPPPTAAEFAARRGPTADAIDIDTARALMGLTQPAMAARVPGGRLAIIDSGFKGLKEWLDANPREKSLVSLRVPATPGEILRFADDPTFAGVGDSDHGYRVYRVVRAVLPDVQVIAYPIRGLHHASTALLNASTQGVVVSNVSLGFDTIFENYNEQEDPFSKALRGYLPQYEAFAFIAAGNERDDTHSWISADRNGNGLVDFRAAPVAGGTVDAIRVRFPARTSLVSLAWDSKTHPDADYELQITAAGGTPVYYSGKARPDAATRGLVHVRAGFSQIVDGEVRVRRLAGPVEGVSMRLRVDGGANQAEINGLQTTNAYLHRENPFAIFVGSFGRTSSGALAPSAFSNIGTAADGRLIPHVLGPGQLVLDGRPTNGTSFSSPFITALYATRVGYNFKNLIARSSNFSRFAPGVAPHERSRWGIPDPALLAKLDDLVGPTRIESVSHSLDNGQLVVKFNITRCCMEDLTWSIAVGVVDAGSGQSVRGANNVPLAATAAMRDRSKADFVRHPAEVRIPVAELAAAKGKKLRLSFDIKVRRWAEPPAGAIKIDSAPAYEFTL